MLVKKLKLAGGVLALLVVALIAGVYVLFAASLPKIDGEIRLNGLGAPVTVNADSQGIPTIAADSREDAFRVLGFLHARDRLFQMDLMRRKSAGRLAEIFGAKAVDLDRNQRDYRFSQAAQRIVGALPAKHRAVLDAYVAGVNAFIAQADIPPPEFIALAYRPEPWRAQDSILVALAMFQTLNGQEQDERMVTVMEQALPESLVKFLTPDTDDYAKSLVGGDGSHRLQPTIPVDEFAALAQPAVASAGGDVDADGVIAGSNNWVVAGAKTADGRAMLANDMHLSLNAPNIWYRAELRYADRYLNGVTLPGLPPLIVGGNLDVAWGFTNATADFLDLVTLELNPRNENEYLTPQGWRRFDSVAETIKVKDGEAVELELRSTIWGPVSSHNLLGRPVAIKWIALDAAAVDLGLLDMDGATSSREAMAVINQAGGPPQNVVFADREGHIGWTFMGRFPKRKGFDGVGSRSWADGSVAWDGYIPSAELPRVFDPPEGFIVTANNRTLGRGYPYVLGYNWASSYRAYRIAELLRPATAITERDMLRVQLDTRSELFEFYRQLALDAIGRAAADRSELAGAVQALRAWDGHMNRDSQGAALLVTLRAKLAEGVFAKVVAHCRRFDPDFKYAWREMETPLRQLLTQRPGQVLPEHYHDDWDQFVVASLQAAELELARQYPGTEPARLSWGSVNRISQQHPFSKTLPMLGAWLNIADFESDGCASFCVKAMTNAHGASERLVLSPARPEDGILQMPGGQSGHPLSSHYRDQQPFWQAGEVAAYPIQPTADRLLFRP